MCRLASVGTSRVESERSSQDRCERLRVYRAEQDLVAFFGNGYAAGTDRDPGSGEETEKQAVIVVDMDT